VSIDAVLFTDFACPWAYSASPQLAALRWRYGDQLDWRVVLIGLSESTAEYDSWGYTPTRQALHYVDFRERFGMPFWTGPRRRLSFSGRACRTVVATRLLHPGREWSVLRALQLAQFNTDLLLDEDPAIRTAIDAVPGIDADAVVAALDGAEVSAAYEADRLEARSAGGSPTEFQGKAAARDGVVRYTAPSVRFTSAGQTLEAGGFQSLDAYDVLIANLDTSLVRAAPPEDPLDALRAFPDGLVTQEVALILAPNLASVDRDAAERALIELAAGGSAVRESLGDDALWLAAAS
jgi:2-hydroxychromene-2-carboxylate isomerase